MDSPFVGPDPLSEKDHLFGRERDLRRMFNLLVAERIVLLHSPSGAGKSSFIQAGFSRGGGSVAFKDRHYGLLEEMRRSGFNPLPVTRANHNLIIPGDDRNIDLNRYSWSVRRQLVRHAVDNAFSGIGRNEIPHLSLSEFLGRAFPEKDRNQAGKDGLQSQRGYHSWVLVIDQFEEVLTEDPSDTNVKKQFFSELGKAMRECRNIWFLLSMREEFTAALDPYLGYLPRRIPVRYRLNMLSREAAVEVIGCIDRSTGESRFKQDGIARVVENLAKFELGRRGSEERELDYIEPIYMQIVCRDLWKTHPLKDSIGADEVRDHGEVKQILIRYYNEQMRDLDLCVSGEEIPERSVREWLSKNLILRGKQRYQIPREEEVTAGLSNSIIKQLIDRHIVHEEKRDENTWLELAHDRLVDAVNDANERWFSKNLGPFQEIARQWNKNGRRADLLRSGEDLQEMRKRWRGQWMEPYEMDFLAQSIKLDWESGSARQLEAQKQQQDIQDLEQKVNDLTGELESTKAELESTKAELVRQARPS